MKNVLLFLFLFKVSCQQIAYVTTTVTKTHTIHPKVLAPATTTVLHLHPRPTFLPYTNTSHPLVQFKLDCKIDTAYCTKVSKAVSAAIDEFTRVVHIKNSIL